MAKKETVVLTGRLDNWVYDHHYQIVWGNINDDIHGRFPDGKYIHTSSITSPDGDIKEGGVIATLNSHYLLGKPLLEEGA